MANLSTILSNGLAVHLRGYLSGLVLSTAGSSATFSVAAGVAVDDTQKDFMTLASSISKTTSAWAVGTGNGGIDTGAVAASTWYHVYLIKRPDTGVVDVLFSLSASAPTMPTNYTLKRRLGSMKTNGSSQWTSFIQIGDEFLWAAPVMVQNNAIVGTTAVLVTMPTPPGIKCKAKIHATVGAGTALTEFIITSPDQTDTAPTAAGGTSFLILANQLATFIADSLTDTTPQVRMRSDNAGCGVYSTVHGWIDTRGKL